MQHFNFRRTIMIVALFAALLTPALLFGSGSQTGPVDVTGSTVTTATAGAADFSVKRINITTASVNLAFGFTSEKIQIITDSSNADEVCIDWAGATAICPSVNVAGDMRMLAGESLFIDNFATSSISVIAASGTQIVFIRAWN